MTDNSEWKFLIKNVFNPEDALSRWIIKLTMARNDLAYVHTRLHEELDKPFNQGSSFYFFRMGISHLRESIKLIHIFRKEPRITDFVKKLSPKHQETYETIKAINEDFESKDSIISKTIKPIRDHSFHYYEDPKKKDKNGKSYEDKFIEQLHNLENLRTSFSRNGKRRIDTNFAFADEISFHILFGIQPGEEYHQALRALSGIMASFIAFSEDSVVHYLGTKQTYMSKITTRK